MHNDSLADIAATHLATKTGWEPLLDKALTREALEAYIATHVARMLRESPEPLMQLLYRLDVAEHHLHDALKLGNNEAAATYLAQHIVARELQKAETRRRYRDTR